MAFNVLHDYLVNRSKLRATLDKGPRSKVQWNQTFLLIKNFKLVSRPLDKNLGPRHIKLWFSLHGIILEKKSIFGPKTKSLQKSSWFGEPKCKLGSKVTHFFIYFFSLFFFILGVQILWEWKTCYELRTFMNWEHCWAHQLSHFWPILECRWLVLWILTKYLLKRMHFQPSKCT